MKSIYSRIIDFIVILILIGILIMSVIQIKNLYICDNGSCENLYYPAKYYDIGSDEYNKELLDRFFGDGVWPIAFFTSFIFAFLCIWLSGAYVTVGNYVLILLIAFMSMYFALNFVIHHYIKPVIEHLRLSILNE